MGMRLFERHGLLPGMTWTGLQAYRGGMPRVRATACTDCGRTADAAGQISWAGLCAACSAVRVAAAVIAMASRSGSPHERWLASRGPQGRPARGKGVSPG